MEHYDGPAFFRKFAVKPSPEQLEDTTAERAQRSVNQRRERNDRLRQREEQETQRQAAAQQAHQAAATHVTPESSAATTESSASAENYRPFQVTPIPKQLHWSHPTAKSRRRYRRLIASLRKDESSFFLFGSADETVDTVATVANHSVDDQTHTATAAVSATSATDSAAVHADAVASQATVKSSVAATSSVTDSATLTVPQSAAVKEAAPTEVFYPTSAQSTATEPADSVASATSMSSSAADYLPVGMDRTTTVSEASQSADTTPTSAATSAASAREATSAAVHVSSAAVVRSTGHLVVSSAAGVPASVASAKHHPAVTATATAKQVSTSVADLGAASSAAVTTSSADTTPVSSAATDQRPAEVDRLLDRAQADDSKAAKTPAKSKAKPSRGLGHSLGDIMQEEGNDQRNLALFDRPTTDTAPANDNDETSTRGYHFPSVDLLPKPVVPDEEALDEWIEHQAEVLDATLSAFHVDAHVTDWTVGPTVTQFQISLALGVKVNKITNLNDDLKLALAAKDIRIEAPIPGKTTVGIEIPNVKSRPVMLSEILNSAAFKNSESPLTVALGVDLFGKPQVTDLRKMPHGLIAGATGSGKSVFINSLLLSILYKATPAQVKLLLIDPKAVEMAPYDALPHLLSPVISDPKAAAAALKWVVTEMDQRYEKLAAAGVRNIEQFNDRADANDEPSLKMPYIVIIIDELADLMMMAASEVQDYIVRITQKARAAGIHLLVATQRPSVDIVTGTIKNNIPTRIAFMVSSQIDSRTILDTAGAESLLGRGDMLYLGNGASQPMRLQGAFVESEVDAITDFVRTQGKPHYAFEPKGLLQRETAEENQDELLPKVLEYIAQEKTVSTSKLQRVFSIGYNRAANLIDDLEQSHYVSPQHGSKPREVYLTPDDLSKDLPEPHDKDAPFSS
ncbi:DNA translocase FtsK [Levilactobacillus tujiorum]|uniref:DNA translocase FtsK n=1 Tax=Levilactobacillus tujiorum TaxID=2912243 RepID=A0ABX1L581_9LACO|nr:DNA translocase FtsK [Levilactobacillus tujiorum]MCH5464524.1 DUF87 domain-containing protein [Levilactobacillus tujiorum]NLR11778.1 DUF87 domain-containing protein [Lactobacillus sp. HBUAS51387]NLR29504.1 DUF87 domain-containing protein [Levilactobacillus tujiorum]